MLIDPRTATPCRTVAFSEDGRVLAEANYLGFITLRETVSGDPIRRFLAQTALVETVRFQRETGYLLLVGAGFEGTRDFGAVKVIDPVTGRRVRELRGHTDDSTDVLSLSGPGQRVVSVGLDKRVIVHQLNPAETWVWSEYEDYLNTCAERPHHEGQLAVAGDSPFTYILDTARRAVLARLDTPGDCNGLLWSDDGRYVLIGDDHGRVLYFDADSGWRPAGECAVGGAAKRMVVDPAHPSRALVACYDGRIWSIPRAPRRGDAVVAVDRRRGMWGINVAATADRIAVPSFFDRAFLLRREPSGALLDLGPEPQATYGCNWVATHPSADVVAITHDDGRVRIRDAVTGELRGILGPDSNSLYMGAAFHPRLPLLATVDFYGELFIYEVETGRVVWRRDLGFGPGITVDFSPCGRFLAAGGYGWAGRMIRLGADGLPVSVEPLDAPNRGVLKNIAFSGSERLLVASGDGTLVIHDLADGRWSAVARVRGEPHMELANGVATSPDGRVAYVVARDQSLRAFDIASRREVACGLAHVRGVKTVHASECGSFIATGSYDRTVMIWAADDLSVRLPPVRVACSGISAVRCAGRRVFACSFDGVVVSIDAETGRVLWMRTAADASEGK